MNVTELYHALTRAVAADEDELDRRFDRIMDKTARHGKGGTAVTHEDARSSELITHTPMMSTDLVVYTIYGLRLSDDTDQALIEEDPGRCLNNGDVGVLWAGRRGRLMTFLALRWDTVPPGEYVFHHGQHPNANKWERDHWNADLHAVVDRLGLKIVEGPGWFTIPSEG